ncbi:thyroid transcription factor 1-associated protein 26 homolog [Adelges cooleyi]|uniref:thyroid transcription factor 1-associated protein 26 homolog n=1 Tax=Adelges cooleyi TaxID=133065 RepID=UPI00217FA93F|nr:thyroid transcription factor 1-associated protein 26 homolog [Adelges cooleyi]
MSEVTNKKKPFDKKKWRTKQYSKKQKIQEWEERRKKAVIKKYYKELSETDSQKNKNISNNNESKSSLGSMRFNPFKEAQEHYNRLQEDKKARRLEASKRKEEIQKALETYKNKKKYKNKKLCKNTRKGQPVMKGRLELLLEKIEADVCNN